jgi:AhpD family alkylhydroperoxidase
MKLDNHMKALIAVGAAVSANCQPCLQKTTAMALENGADEKEVAEAIEVGKRVRHGAATKMDQFVIDLSHMSLPIPNGECDCHSVRV